MSWTDPTTAREWIEDNGVDVPLTDLEMPSVNGLELLRTAKGRSLCAQVLFLMGNSSINALTDALKLGATDYLLKPVGQGELVELIEDAVRRVHRWCEALAGTLSVARKGSVMEVLVAPCLACQTDSPA